MSSQETAQRLGSAYRRGAAVLRDAVEGMDASSLRARPMAGKMSSLEVLSHIVDSDQFMCDRIKRTIATDRPLLIGVESADYPGPLAYHDREPELDLQLLAAQRAAARRGPRSAACRGVGALGGALRGRGWSRSATS